MNKKIREFRLKAKEEKSSEPIQVDVFDDGAILLLDTYGKRIIYLYPSQLNLRVYESYYGKVKRKNET